MRHGKQQWKSILMLMQLTKIVSSDFSCKVSTFTDDDQIVQEMTLQHGQAD